MIAFATEALRYAFDDGEIKGRSAEALRAALPGETISVEPSPQTEIAIVANPKLRHPR